MFGNLLHLFVGPILNRMFHEHLEGIEPQGFGLCSRRLAKFDRRQKSAGYAPAIQICNVMQTARRAGPSVGQCFHDQVALGRNLLFQ